MKCTNIRYAILTSLFAVVALTSCVDDDMLCIDPVVDAEIPEGIRSGYSLTLTVTLDNFGTTRAVGDPLEDIDNYINPEKFRVLFFDDDENFLFESKSRWVKQLSSGSDYSEWLVSVPVFTYGNDIYEIDGEKVEWDWDYIREKLTTKSFRIAILANRPDLDWYPSFTNTETLKAQWYDNSGPNWNPNDTGHKKIFDLHHCQYDPMYHGKGMTAGYYDFIMGDWDTTTEPKFEDWRPSMGATASWLDWGDGHNSSNEGLTDAEWEEINKDFTLEHNKVGDKKYPVGYAVSYTRLPSQDYPIPMYGLQKFDKLDNWVKGTPFNLSKITTSQEDGIKEYNYQSISLLRSVVKLELLIPKTAYSKAPRFVSLWYPNIYSRCDPMNIWEPTNDIWEKDHENNCEWNAIMNYGPISSNVYTTDGTPRNTDDPNRFKKIMSWFYGAWQDKYNDGTPRWDFNGFSDLATAGADTPYPKIFNPLIQRNKLVLCPKEANRSQYYNDDYWHYVVYTGERSMTDPNEIPQLISSNAYAVSWMFRDPDDNNKDGYYCIPIADYSNGSGNQLARSCFGPYNFDTDIRTSLKSREIFDEDGNNIKDEKGENKKEDYYDINLPSNTVGDMSNYGNNLRDAQSREEMPWPLLRNHVYTLTLSSYYRTWDFKTISELDLNTDISWSNAKGLETKVLAYSKDGNAILINNKAGSAEVNWWNSGNPTLTRNATREFESDNSYPIKDYISIKTSSGTQNKLTLPDGKIAKKITFYSHVNNTTTPEPYFEASCTTSDDNKFNKGETIDMANYAKITTGCSMETVNDDTDGISYTKSGYFTLNASKHYFKITLNKKLKAGDEISATVRQKTDKEMGILLCPSASRTTSSPAVKVDISSTADTPASGQYTIIAGDELEGKDVIYIYRKEGTGTSFNNLTISRAPDTNTYWSEMQGDNNLKVDMYAYQNSSFVDEYSLEFEQPQKEITFTSAGEQQVDYIAYVDVENESGLPNYWELNNPSGELTANGKTVKGFEDLEFSSSNGSIRIYNTDPGKVELTNNSTITFKGLKDGYTVTIKGQSADSNTATITPVSNLTFVESGSDPQQNGQCIFGNDKTYTFKWEVDNGTDVSFNTTGDVYFYEFRVVPPTTTANGARATRATAENGIGFAVKSKDSHAKSIKFK